MFPQKTTDANLQAAALLMANLHDPEVEEEMCPPWELTNISPFTGFRRKIIDSKVKFYGKGIC